MNAANDIHNIDIAQRSGEICNLINCRNLSREQNIVGVFDQLRRSRIDSKLFARPGSIDLVQKGQRAGIFVTKDDAIRMHEIVNGVSLPKKLWIHTQSKITEPF